jgi:3-phenylpropionate/cinnamic acid dioxygenase small subunit
MSRTYATNGGHPAQVAEPEAVERLLLQREVEGFLCREADLLDRGDMEGWLGLVTEDIRYVVPVRSTRYSRLVDEFSKTSFVFDDDLYGLKMRVARLSTRFAWAEDPASRNRHFISNVIVTADEGATIHVRSNVLLYRSRLDDVAAELLTGARHDVLQRTHAGLRLARREVYLDQTVLSVSAITTFI